MQHFKIRYGTDPQGFYWGGPNGGGSASKRAEVMAIKRGAPAIFEATYQNRPGQREGSIFLESDFVEFVPPPMLTMGVMHSGIREFLKRGTCVQAWDTAFTKTKASAYTVCVTGLLVPCDKYHRGEDPDVFGPCEFHFDLLILDVLREKLDWGDLVPAFKRQHNKWRPEMNLVELRASGIPLFQSLQSTGIPILGIQTEQGKRARAVEGTEAGSAQGWFRQHRVLTPSPGPEAPWLAQFKTELKDFSGNDDALSDQVDATVHLLRYVIETGAKSAHLPTDWTPERGTPFDQADISQAGIINPDKRIDFLHFLNDAPSMVFDPFAGACGRCQAFEHEYCNVHKRATVSLDTCALFAEKVDDLGSTYIV